MIHFKSYGSIPKSYYDSKMKCVTARGTLYGVHKNNDSHSKTHILCFTDSRLASNFKEYLTKIQHSGKTIERCSEFKNIIIPYVESTGSKMPLRVDDYSLIDLMKTCYLNYFDLYVVYDSIPENDVMTLHCYTYESTDYPNRGYINVHLHHMLHRD